jgi:hypothetical protein
VFSTDQRPCDIGDQRSCDIGDQRPHYTPRSAPYPAMMEGATQDFSR